MEIMTRGNQTLLKRTSGTTVGKRRGVIFSRLLLLTCSLWEVPIQDMESDGENVEEDEVEIERDNGVCTCTRDTKNQERKEIVGGVGSSW